MTESEDNQQGNVPVLNNTIPLKKEKKENSIWELVKFALIAIAIVIPIRVFIAQPFIVSGLSMFPTFHNSDYLIVDQISYRFKKPQRGDVVIFKYPKDPSKYFIKRLIGLPNEEVILNGNTVKIKNKEHPDGFILDEPYIKNQSNNMMDVIIHDDEYFMMGDNRSASSDSRVWGVLPKRFITGRALIRLLPIKGIDLFPGKNNY